MNESDSCRKHNDAVQLALLKRRLGRQLTTDELALVDRTTGYLWEQRGCVFVTVPLFSEDERASVMEEYARKLEAEAAMDESQLDRGLDSLQSDR
ncbi:MAG: hypothetical protein AB7Q00_13900 [Phycisphaerales bacterium]